MRLEDIDKLKKYCKNEKAFDDLSEIFENLIEERNELDQQLKLLESAIRDDYDSILITTLDLEKPGPRIVYVNEGFCKMTGYSKDEVIGKTPRILQGPKTDEKVLEKLKKNLKEGRPFFGQTINYRKDGSEFVNQWDIHPLKDEDGNITHWVSYQHDISARKKAEEFLVNQQVEFNGLREESMKTIVDLDLDGNIINATRSFCDLVGYTRDELKNTKGWELFAEKFMNSLKRRFDEKDEFSHFDNEEFQGIIKHKKGLPIQIRGNTKIMDLKDRRIIRSEVENISLKKRIMDTLEKRNFDYSNIVKKASEYTYSLKFKKDGTPIYKHFSAEFPVVTGYTSESMEGKDNAKKFIHKDDLGKYYKHFGKVKSGTTSTCTYRISSKNGDYIEVLDYAKPEWDENEEVVMGAYCSVSFDEAFKKAKG